MPRLLTPQNTVLLVCDVQERFRSAIFGFDAVVGTIVKMVKAAGLLQMPVVTTEQNPKALGSTVPEIGLDSLPSELNLGVIPKTKFSMMPDILSLPNKPAGHFQSIAQNAIIVGIESHVCVLQTTLSLLDTGVSVYVLADGVSSCNRQEIPIALDRLRAAGAIITTSESILFQLVDDAKQPLFKPFASLIKESKPATSTALQTLLDGSWQKSSL